MKKRKIELITRIVLLLTVISMVFLNTSAFALSWGEISDSAGSFIDKGEEKSTVDPNTMFDIIKPIGGILLGIASIVFFVVGVMLGLQLMSANDQKRAQVKQKMIWYVVAIVLVYGAVGITALVLNIIGLK